MNNRSSTDVRVGIAVGIALVLFIITVVLLGGDKSIFSSTYTLKIPFDRIDGLAPGALVRLSGFQIGSVSDIQFSEKDDRLVVYVKILKKYQDRITKKSMADLRTQGALGDKYVSIDPGEPGADPLKDGDILPVEKSADLFTTISQRGEEIGKVFDILHELDKFTKTLNVDNRSDKVMQNLVNASQHMDQAMAQFQMAVKDLRGDNGKNLKNASAHLESILEKIDNGNGTIGELINDPTIHEKIKALLGGSKRNDYMKGLIQKTIQEAK